MKNQKGSKFVAAAEKEKKMTVILKILQQRFPGNLLFISLSIYKGYLL